MYLNQKEFNSPLCADYDETLGNRSQRRAKGKANIKREKQMNILAKKMIKDF